MLDLQRVQFEDMYDEFLVSGSQERAGNKGLLAERFYEEDWSDNEFNDDFLDRVQRSMTNK
jgi:hypothetical protein